ncbi:MAG: plasma-membrane proton-efflux P-type ATPase, partial [Betaproteobacteria bacterium]|nr:plasma-membrane proton-efflux P-type ATPase [Betaproteobacteria bacterium]
MPDNASPTGLTLAQVRALQQQYGPNAVPEPVVHPWRQFAARFWGPVPWMLELAVVLQLVLAKWAEAAVMALLLTLNAVVSFLQERKADRTVALLQHELAVTCRVQRDGAWQRVPAAELVPGDRIHLRNGGFVPADVQVADGSMLVDQSALTGEALPVEAGAGSVAYAGSLVRRGEATGTVSATGTHTFFGKTAELVRVAKSPGHLSGLIMRIVRVLIVFDALLAAAVAVYATATGMPLHELLPYLLI